MDKTPRMAGQPLDGRGQLKVTRKELRRPGQGEHQDRHHQEDDLGRQALPYVAPEGKRQGSSRAELPQCNNEETRQEGARRRAERAKLAERAIASPLVAGVDGAAEHEAVRG